MPNRAEGKISGPATRTDKSQLPHRRARKTALHGRTFDTADNQQPQENSIIPEGVDPIKYGARLLRQELHDYLTMTDSLVRNFPHSYGYQEKNEHSDSTHPVYYIPLLAGEVEGSEAIGESSKLKKIAALFPDGSIKINMGRVSRGSRLSIIPENFRPPADNEIVVYAPFLVASLAILMSLDLSRPSEDCISDKQIQDRFKFLQTDRHTLLKRINDISVAALKKSGKNAEPVRFSEEEEALIAKTIERVKTALDFFDRKPSIIAKITEAAKSGNSDLTAAELGNLINELKGLEFYPTGNPFLAFRHLDGQAYVLTNPHWGDHDGKRHDAFIRTNNEYAPVAWIVAVTKDGKIVEIASDAENLDEAKEYKPRTAEEATDIAEAITRAALSTVLPKSIYKEDLTYAVTVWN